MPIAELTTDEVIEGPEGILAGRFRVQAIACAFLGSQIYAGLMEQVADDIENQGVFLRLLKGFESEPGRAALALRLFGAVHKLVLDGSAPDLARFYPSAGGTDDAGERSEKAWPLFRAVVQANEKFCRKSLSQPPQTNEVGRCAALMPGFIQVYQQTGLPLRLLELGASAGLNLAWDHYCYERNNGEVIGDMSSQLRFPSSWYPDGIDALISPVSGASQVDGSAQIEMPPIESRQGCDRTPLDISTREGQVTLASYVWPEQIERFLRLRAALDIAHAAKIKVTKADACEWLRARLRQHAEGVCRVIFHSIFIQYLTESDRKYLIEMITEAGHRARKEEPIAWLRMEPIDEGEKARKRANNTKWPIDRAQVRLSIWPGGGDFVIAAAGFHGQPVELPPN